MTRGPIVAELLRLPRGSPFTVARLVGLVAARGDLAVDEQGMVKVLERLEREGRASRIGTWWQFEEDGMSKKAQAVEAIPGILVGRLTRSEIALRAGCSGSVAYHALRVLQADGRVQVKREDGRDLWALVDVEQAADTDDTPPAPEPEQVAPLELVPDHTMECRTCGVRFDRRDLDQVIAHEHQGLHEATGIRGEPTPTPCEASVPDAGDEQAVLEGDAGERFEWVARGPRWSYCIDRQADPPRVVGVIDDADEAGEWHWTICRWADDDSTAPEHLNAGSEAQARQIVELYAAQL